jgi:hypothetical protein
MDDDTPMGRAESGGRLELEQEQTTIMRANAVRACGHARGRKSWPPGSSVMADDVAAGALVICVLAV